MAVTLMSAYSVIVSVPMMDLDEFGVVKTRSP